jgi:hypothetical protein
MTSSRRLAPRLCVVVSLGVFVSSPRSARRERGYRVSKPVHGAVIWSPSERRWGWGDALAILVWSGAIALFFWDALSLQKALFYFDITEINYPYRHFFASELKAGRFSRWCPGLYCGLPLFSESQVGYLHPLKYLFYPWLPTWKAFNLDTIVSVWLVGLATYGWLRRHVGPIGALGGAATFGLSGFMWAHFIHTSMTNALVSVPLSVWALECVWDSGRLRGVALGGLAVACQVFAGHLQDMLLTGLLLLLYGLYRATSERRWANRLFVLGTAAGIVTTGVLVSAVQWIPSKELLDRSPRAGGLTWQDLTYGSWHPELLPTLIVREAYGTRARDTDWMDGFYPYHEMNAYLGVLGLGLAVLGGAAYRDRWVGFWVLVVGVGMTLMLGRFTAIFDGMNYVPILGSSRIPIRYHLWVSLAVAALAAVGLDRLARTGPVRIRWAVGLVLCLVVVSIPILLWVYQPIWSGSNRWSTHYHKLRYQWLGSELALAGARTALLATVGAAIAVLSARISTARTRARLVAILPVLMLMDLLGSHWVDVPTITPDYWTKTPASVGVIKSDPAHQRVFGFGVLSAGEPGYATGAVGSARFLRARDTLAWSLPIVWGLSSGAGETPIHPQRFNDYADYLKIGEPRYGVEGVSHVLSSSPEPMADWPKPVRAGSAYLHRNPRALPRVRYLGFPSYAKNQADAVSLLRRFGASVRTELVVEDPDRPLETGSAARGTARILSEVPEEVVVEVLSETAGYLVLADAFDPGWSATIDGLDAPIRPAYVNFRAVYVAGAGRHRVIFRYEPAGWRIGLSLTIAGLFLTGLMLAIPWRVTTLGSSSGPSDWPVRWPGLLGALILVLILVSIGSWSGARPTRGARWNGSFHRFTWGAGIEAMRLRPPPR